jgi:hypothetical protein
VTAALAVCGLVALLPVAWGLALGRVGLADAGVRAIATVVVVVVAGRLLTRALLFFADTLDGRWRGDRSTEESSPVPLAEPPGEPAA